MHHSDDRTGQLSRLYPDLVSAGGLVTALVEGSRRRHLNLDIDSSDDLNKWPYAVVRTLGGYLSVNLGIEERWFLLAGWRRGVCLVHGKTDSLIEVADAASAWSDGHTLHQLKQRCSFIDYSELAEDHERGPAQAVAQQWLNLLRVGSMPHTAAVLQEAYARPELRELFAFTSHWAVHFSRCTGYPYTWDIPWIEPLASGDYRTMSPSSAEIVTTRSAEEAIDLVVANLPPGCGPAVAGTADDL